MNEIEQIKFIVFSMGMLVLGLVVGYVLRMNWSPEK